MEATKGFHDTENFDGSEHEINLSEPPIEGIVPLKTQINSLRNLLKNPKVLTPSEKGFAELLEEIATAFEWYQRAFEINMERMETRLKHLETRRSRKKKGH